MIRRDKHRPRSALFRCNSPYTADDDGFEGPLGDGSDCDDLNANVNPGAVEVCDDTFDNDCDGFTDCDDPVYVNDPACPP